MDLDVIEIEPIRVGIEFEMAAALARGRDHRFHIHLVSIAFATAERVRSEKNSVPSGITLTSPLKRK